MLYYKVTALCAFHMWSKNRKTGAILTN